MQRRALGAIRIRGARAQAAVVPALQAAEAPVKTVDVMVAAAVAVPGWRVPAERLAPAVAGRRLAQAAPQGHPRA